MIIIGYPGVGKTDASKQFLDVIDLESSWFDGINNIYNNDIETYCKIAIELSKQNYIVCVSSHKEIQACLRRSVEDVYVCYPIKELKQYWAQKLRERYIVDDTDKNFRAYDRAIDYFDRDIQDMMDSGFKQLPLSEGMYLTDIIKQSYAQASGKKENNDEDNTAEVAKEKKKK